jgi:fucose 4-O-acetylase-like acetyltransferase
MDTQERLHSLDAVRAFALLSGVVLHAAMTFMPGLAAFGFPADVSQSPQLQTAFFVIHMFRMSLFFFIGGYFARRMFHRDGQKAFVRDRLKRIGIPMLAGWLFFGPLAMVLVYVAFGPSLPAGVTPPKPTGFPWAHIWFLYYLAMLYVIVLAVRAVFVRWFDADGRRRARLDAWLANVLANPAGPAVIAAPVAIALYSAPNWIPWSGIPSPDTGLLPSTAALIAFGVAFGLGWLLQRQRDAFAVMRARWDLNLSVAVLCTVGCLWMLQRMPNPFVIEPTIKLAFAATYALGIWTWVFGLVGVATRFLTKARPSIRYLADSSYWIYLAHLPVVFALQLAVLKWPLHWSVKFPLVVSVALAVLLLSYHVCVRRTAVGRLLRGRSFTQREAHASIDMPAPATGLDRT